MSVDTYFAQDTKAIRVLLGVQGGNLRKALQFAEGRQQLNWYCKGSNIALDIIRGLQFLHSQSVSALHQTNSLCTDPVCKCTFPDILFSVRFQSVSALPQTYFSLYGSSL